jgi:hypothetical protein
MGLKYLIDDGPTQTLPNVNPVWTIRKYNRYPLQIENRQTNVESVEGTYFAIAENIYQAPSLKDILTCRLVTIPYIESFPGWLLISLNSLLYQKIFRSSTLLPPACNISIPSRVIVTDQPQARQLAKG